MNMISCRLDIAYGKQYQGVRSEEVKGTGLSQSVPISSQSRGGVTSSPQSMPIPSPQSMPIPSPQSIPISSPQSIPISSPQSMPISSPQSIPISSPQSMPISSPQSIPISSPQSIQQKVPSVPSSNRLSILQPISATEVTFTLASLIEPADISSSVFDCSLSY